MMKSRISAFALAIAFALSGVAGAEEAPSQPSSPAADATVQVGMVDAPCPPQKAPSAAILEVANAAVTPGRPFVDYIKSASPATLAALAQQQKDQEIGKTRDWPDTCLYKPANAALRGHKPKVAFMGDSITQMWASADPAMFGEDIVDRGISGQTSEQMLVRFMQDVVNLKPQVVHILAGVNDIAGNTGPNSPEDYKNMMRAMVTLARANHIAVVIGSILPCNRFPFQPKSTPAPRIAELNAWLRAFAAENHAQFVDYYSALAGPESEFPAKLSNDGLHPNRDGFAIMGPLAEAAITRAVHANHHP